MMYSLNLISQYLTSILSSFHWQLTNRRGQFLSIVVLVCAIASSAQAQSTSNPDVVLSPELRVISIEQNYDRQVSQVLSNYFNHTNFFVNVNLNAEIVEESYQTTQSRVNRSSSSDFTMPGLPYLPSENRQPDEISETEETVRNENIARILRIRNLQINIRADSSLTDDEVAFMKQAASTAVKLNQSRGDSVTITKMAMPQFSSNLPQVATTNNQNTSSDSPSFIASLNQYVPLALLLLFIVLIVFVSRLTDTEKEKITQLSQREDLKNRNNRQQHLHSSLATQEATNKNKHTSEIDKLVNKFFQYPKQVAFIFESWIEEHQKEGVTNSAKVVNSAGKQLLKSLKPFLNSTHYQLIRSTSEDISSIPPSEKKEIAGQFNNNFEAGDSGADPSSIQQSLHLLKFLEYLSDDQIISVIETEDALSSALILDQLPKQKAATILDQLDKEQATDILLSMTKLGDLSYKEQKSISSNLFEKAIGWMQNKTDEEYHSQYLMDVLENLPFKDQRSYIEKLKENDGNIGEYLERHFITIEKIPYLSDKVLKNATISVDTDTLIDALSGFEQPIVDKVLSVRPKREQRLIRMEIERLENEKSTETEHATSLLMNAIRNAAKDSKN